MYLGHLRIGRYIQTAQECATPFRIFYDFLPEYDQFASLRLRFSQVNYELFKFIDRYVSRRLRVIFLPFFLEVFKSKVIYRKFKVVRLIYEPVDNNRDEEVKKDLAD